MYVHCIVPIHRNINQFETEMLIKTIEILEIILHKNLLKKVKLCRSNQSVHVGF